MDRKQAVHAGAAVYSTVCLIVLIVFSRKLIVGINRDNGEQHLVVTQPRYEQAKYLAGYFDDRGLYLGGSARWNDWTEGQSSCSMVSANGRFCERWKTFRYGGSPTDENISGSCLCSGTATDVNSTMLFCPSWSCEEAWYPQSKTIYTMCDCNEDGQEYTSTHCEEWTCFTGPDVDPVDGSTGAAEVSSSSAIVVPDSGDDDEYQSSTPMSSENVAVVPTSWELGENNFELHFSCFQSTGSKCSHWRGMTDERVASVLEEICECPGTSSADYCLEWSCTTYHMLECDVCWTDSGGTQGTIVVVFAAPLVALGFHGYPRLAVGTTLLGLAAACCMAAYVGGVEAVLGRVLPFTIVMLVGVRHVARAMTPAQIEPYLPPFLQKEPERNHNPTPGNDTMNAAAGGAPYSPSSAGAYGSSPYGGQGPESPTQQTHQSNAAAGGAQPLPYPGSYSPTGSYGFHPTGSSPGPPPMMMQHSPPPGGPGSHIPPPTYGFHISATNNAAPAGSPGSHSPPTYGGGFQHTDANNMAPTGSPGSLSPPIYGGGFYPNTTTGGGAPGFSAGGSRAPDYMEDSTPVFRPGVNGGTF